MTNVTRGAAILFGLICIFVGLIDLAEQYRLGEELRWRVPIILFGCGVGLPLVLFPISNLFESDASGNPDDSGDFDTGGDAED